MWGDCQSGREIEKAVWENGSFCCTFGAVATADATAVSWQLRQHRWPWQWNRSCTSERRRRWRERGELQEIPKRCRFHQGVKRKTGTIIKNFMQTTALCGLERPHVHQIWRRRRRARQQWQLCSGGAGEGMESQRHFLAFFLSPLQIRSC